MVQLPATLSGGCCGGGSCATARVLATNRKINQTAMIFVATIFTATIFTETIFALPFLMTSSTHSAVTARKCNKQPNRNQQLDGAEPAPCDIRFFHSRNRFSRSGPAKSKGHHNPCHRNSAAGR